MSNKHQYTETLGDSDPMPFGEYKGRPMDEVPASRLLWYYEQWEKDPSQYMNADKRAVKNYIEDSWDFLQKEIGQ